MPFTFMMNAKRHNECLASRIAVDFNEDTDTDHDLAASRPQQHLMPEYCQHDTNMDSQSDDLHFSEDAGTPPHHYPASDYQPAPFPVRAFALNFHSSRS